MLVIVLREICRFHYFITKEDRYGWFVARKLIDGVPRRIISAKLNVLIFVSANVSVNEIKFIIIDQQKIA